MLKIKFNKIYLIYGGPSSERDRSIQKSCKFYLNQLKNIDLPMYVGMKMAHFQLREKIYQSMNLLNLSRKIME